MGVRVQKSTLTRFYRDSTNEVTSVSIDALVPAADGSDYTAIRNELAAVLDAMEAFQSVNTQLVRETFSVSVPDPNGTDIPTDSAVQREATVTFFMNDGSGSTFQRTIGCANHANVTLAGQGSDEISPASAEWQAVNAAVAAANIISPYGQTGVALQKAVVSGRNN